MADVAVPTAVDPSDRAFLATTTASVERLPSGHQSAVLDFDRVSASLGKPSGKKHLKILDILVVLCTQIPAPKLWIMMEAWLGSPKLQNFDAIFRNSIMVANAHLVWRTLLLAFNLLPIGLKLAYKVFVGGYSTHVFGNHRSSYGMTGAPGLTRTSVLKFGPAYNTNATLPYIMASADHETLPLFPQTSGFNNFVISNTSSAFLDAPLPSEVLPLQQSLAEDTTSTLTLTADVHATVTTYNHSIETLRDEDAFWDSYLNQSGLNSEPDSFALGISWIDLSNQWIPAFRANAFLFNTRREICKARWHITYNSMQLVDEGSCTVSSPLPSQDLLVTRNLAFGTYYMPSLAEYLAPLSTPIDSDPTEQNVYEWSNQWLMSTFTTTIAAMYWSRLTALFGPDNSATSPEYNAKVNCTIPDTLLSNRQTMDPSWGLYVVLGVQPVLLTLVFIAGFALSHFSAVDGGNFGIIAILAGVRTETLKLFNGASFSGTLTKPIGMKIETMTSRREKEPQNQYSFIDDGVRRESFGAASLKRRFTSSRFDMRGNTGYQQIDT
ncbi:hypothetical protein BDR22DRAFT_826265 [Usnea florida]